MNATVTISNNRVSPGRVTIGVGGHVTFRNNDQTFHQINSDPHPIHTDCPPINDVGLLNAGQQRATGAFPNARTCTYHDHLQPNQGSMQGTIVIQ